MSMWPFRKKDDQPAPAPQACNHKWTDFPWFIDYSYTNARSLRVMIKEPYVCVHCKKRKDVTLFDRTWSGLKYKDAMDIVSEYEREFENNLLPQAVVEDMINDMQLVDREYLFILDKLRNAGNQGG